jgi:putative membrane protein
MGIRSMLAGAGCFALAAAMAWGAALSKADKDFMIMAAKTDMTEAHQGQMAEHQASQTQVQDLGKTLVQDYTASYTQLSDLAAKTGVSIPRGIDAAKNRDIASLTHLKGIRFDRRFTRDERAAQRQELTRFEREAKHGEDPQVKQYAATQIPVLKKDLRLAEQSNKPARRS